MAKNVTSLPEETFATLDGTENVVMFDSAEGKRSTLSALSDYAIKKHTPTGMTETLYQQVTEIKAAVGSPLVTNTASAMTDQTKVYVYTGSETGYTAGHWYYYNGTAWADGGVYNASAVSTDKTLSISDKAADAKVVGDALALKVEEDDVEDAITASVDSTLSTTGKSADAKVTGDTLAEKADKDGVIATAEGLIGGAYTVEKEPYHFRKTAVDLAGRLDETIVGGSLGWNQLVQNGNFENATGWSAGPTAPTVSNNIASYTATSDGTMSLALRRSATVVADHKVLSIADVWCDSNNEYRIRYPFVSSKTSTTANTWTAIEKIGIVGSGETQFGVQSNSINGASYKCRKAMLIDLTQMFGTTIADYIYSLEQSTAGAGVAWVKRYIDLDTYHEYDAGSIQSVEGLQSHKTYDDDENLLATYPLDSSVTLRGVPKLVTDHIEFDGDKYLSDGTLERRYGVVDLGTLNWAKVSSGESPFFQSPLSVSYKYVSLQNNFLCVKYQKASIGGSGDAVGIFMTDNNYIRIRDNTYTDAATFKTAMSGVYLVYELATPTTETAQPFQSPMIVGATEEYISDSVVPVGHESKYYEDVAKKVSGLPKDFSTLIAPTEVTFTATRNYSVGSYLIVKNQLYKVTSAISSGGTITPNSNVTATTIMAEILALA